MGQGQKDLGRVFYHGLSDCCKSPQDCCNALCCPCCAIGSNHQLRSDRGYKCWVCNAPCWVTGCMMCLCPCIICFYTSALRGHNRRTMGIAGTYWEDCCLHCFCFPCAITQESLELQQYRFGATPNIGPARQTMGDYGGVDTNEKSQLAFDD